MKFDFHIENVLPILYVGNMKRSVDFYVDLLGFENAEWGDANFTSVNRGNTGLYLSLGNQGNPGTWIWIGFDGDIFALHDHLKRNGVKIKLPPLRVTMSGQPPGIVCTCSASFLVGKSSQTTKWF